MGSRPLRGDGHQAGQLRWFKHDSLAVYNPECRACTWLPLCMGGCTFERSKGNRDCLPWKDDPQKFVLVQYGRLGEKLREVLGRKVDLHTPLNDGSDPAVAAFVRRHQVLVYERG